MKSNMRKKSTAGSNDDARSTRQTVYQRGNPRDSSPHYVFLYSDDESEEEILLQPRNQSKSPPRKIEVINVILKPEDTLQALALRYRCTLSELKRINNIHKENEIFAHRSVKVPVTAFGIFTEINSESHAPEDNLNCDILSEKIEPQVPSREQEIINLIANPISLPSTSRDINSVILNSTLEPLPSTFRDDEADHVYDDESEQLLSTNDRGNSADGKFDTFSCSGADWGLSWTHLLGMSLLLSFAGPVIYILYIAESDHKHEGT